MKINIYIEIFEPSLILVHIFDIIMPQVYSPNMYIQKLTTIKINTAANGKFDF